MQILNLPGPKAEALIQRDAAVISPSYARAYPFVMDHGKGSYLWDVDGNQFLDFMAGIAVNSTGHSHPRVVKRFKTRLRNLFTSLPTFTMNRGSNWAKNWTGLRLSKKTPCRL